MSTTVLRSFSPQKSPPKFLLPSQPSSARGAVGSRPCSPDCILGYTGSKFALHNLLSSLFLQRIIIYCTILWGRFKNFDEDDNKKTTILPIIGYTGDYRGKVEGKFGRAEVSCCLPTYMYIFPFSNLCRLTSFQFLFSMSRTIILRLLKMAAMLHSHHLEYELMIQYWAAVTVLIHRHQLKSLLLVIISGTIICFLLDYTWIYTCIH